MGGGDGEAGGGEDGSGGGEGDSGGGDGDESCGGSVGVDDDAGLVASREVDAPKELGVSTNELGVSTDELDTAAAEVEDWVGFDLDLEVAMESALDTPGWGRIMSMVAEGADESMDTEEPVDAVLPSVVDGGDGSSGEGDDCGGAGGNGGGGLGAPRTSCAQPNLLVA